MSEYPEHDKLTAVKDESQAIGEFLDMAGYTLCEMVTYVDTSGRGIGRTREPRLAPVSKSIQQILADYFDIDLAKIETEKRAMLDALRAANA